MLRKIYTLLFVLFIASNFSASAYAGSDWNITLKVSGGGMYDYCIAGVKEGANDTLDRLWDIPAPPGGLNTTYIYAYFPHPEWNDVFERFRQDIRASDLPKEWIFEVVSNISGNFTIQWPDIRNAIPDKDAAFVDMEGSGIEIDMHAVSQFLFTYSAGQPRMFLIRISQKYIPVPEPPKNLNGKQVANSKSLLLHWRENRELDLAGYNVYRSATQGSGYQRINYSIVSQHKFTDTRIAQGQTYYYVVTAVNDAGGESGYSNEIEEVIAMKGKPGRGK